MSSLQAQLEDVQNKFKALDKNIQRVLILGVAFLLYTMVDTFAVQPMVTEYDGITKQITKSISDRKVLEKQISLVSKQLGIDPDLPDDEQLNVLKVKISELDEILKTASAQFVTADEMIGFLNDMLIKSKKLELLSMEKLPLEYTVLKTIENNKRSSKKSNLKNSKVVSEAKVYRHGVIFTLSGRYIEIVRYMQALENMPWRIFWEASSLNTEEYPSSTVSFKIYTLSLDENWLTL